jgi:indole-3-glycerol phosphate synthase
VTTTGGDLLTAMVAAARRSAAGRAAAGPGAGLEGRAAAAAPRAAQFAEALHRPERVNVIAECKRRSPVAGVLSRRYDPASLAAAYEAAGAAAISVLTEPAFFDGSLDHLQVVRQATRLPVLRKDFIVTHHQLLEARAYGADAVLLIVAALQQDALAALLREAGALGLAALVEVHDETELDRALEAGADILGVNNRNLRTMTVSLETSRRLVERIPEECIAVAESGLREAAELRELRGLGYDAFLIGETLVRQPAPGVALGALIRAAERVPSGRVEATGAGA